MVWIEQEVARIALALGRRFDVEGALSPRIAQQCPLCSQFAWMGAEWMWRSCSASCSDFSISIAVIERAERIAACDPELKHRAEHEADLMAARCEELRKQT